MNSTRIHQFILIVNGGILAIFFWFLWVSQSKVYDSLQYWDNPPNVEPLLLFSIIYKLPVFLILSISTIVILVIHRLPILWKWHSIHLISMIGWIYLVMLLISAATKFLPQITLE